MILKLCVMKCLNYLNTNMFFYRWHIWITWTWCLSDV